MNINQYPNEAFQINDEDFYDVDYWNGLTYETRKISGATLKAALAALAPNIYSADGTLSGDRIVTGANFELFFQSIGGFIVHSHQNNQDNVIFEVRSDPTFHGFIVKDHNTGVHMLACRNGAVEISDAYFLPSVDGNAGDVISTDGAGNTSWIPLPASLNIYNSDGQLTGNRLVDLNSFLLQIFNQSSPSGPQLVMCAGSSKLEWLLSAAPGDKNTFYAGATFLGLSVANAGIPIQFTADDLRFVNLTSGQYAKMDTSLITGGFKNYQWPNQSGIIALTQDILNIYNSDGMLSGSRFVDLNGNVLYFIETAGQSEFRGNEISVLANAGFEALMKLIAGNGQKRGFSFQDQGNDRWEIVAEGVETGGNAGTDFVIYRYDDAGVLLGIAMKINRASGAIEFNNAYEFPIADGNPGEALITDGAGNLSFQPVSGGGVEKKIDTFYAYDMSAAAAGGGTYTWNGTAVGASAITTLNERYRLQIFSGVGQADGCFVNSILPSYYVTNANIRIDLAHTVNGAGGDYKIFVGLVKPNGANYGDNTSTLWQSAVITAAAGFPQNQSSFNFSGIGLNAGESIGILIYRDPGDAQDTFTGDIYINSVNVEQV